MSPPNRVVVPLGLKILLEGLSKSAVSSQPENVAAFGSLYFTSLLHFRKEKPDLSLADLMNEFKETNGSHFYTDKMAQKQAAVLGPENFPHPKPIKNYEAGALLMQARHDNVKEAFPSVPDELPSLATLNTDGQSADPAFDGDTIGSGIDHFLSATTITLSPGPIPSELAQDLAVFRRAANSEASSRNSPTGEPGLTQIHSALFERVSLSELDQDADAVLIRTGSLPLESMIIVQTEEVPEMIVFQADSRLAGKEEPNGDVTSTTDCDCCPTNYVDKEESPLELVGTSQPLHSLLPSSDDSFSRTRVQNAVGAELDKVVTPRDEVPLPQTRSRPIPVMPSAPSQVEYQSPAMAAQEIKPTRSVERIPLRLCVPVTEQNEMTTPGLIHSPMEPEYEQRAPMPVRSSEYVMVDRVPSKQSCLPVAAVVQAEKTPSDHTVYLPAPAPRESATVLKKRESADPPYAVATQTGSNIDFPSLACTPVPIGDDQSKSRDPTAAKTPYLVYLPLPPELSRTPSMVYQMGLSPEEVKHLPFMCLPMNQAALSRNPSFLCHATGAQELPRSLSIVSHTPAFPDVPLTHSLCPAELSENHNLCSPAAPTLPREMRGPGLVSRPFSLYPQGGPGQAEGTQSAPHASLQQQEGVVNNGMQADYRSPYLNGLGVGTPVCQCNDLSRNWRLCQLTRPQSQSRMCPYPVPMMRCGLEHMAKIPMYHDSGRCCCHPMLNSHPSNGSLHTHTMAEPLCPEHSMSPLGNPRSCSNAGLYCFTPSCHMAETLVPERQSVCSLNSQQPQQSRSSLRCAHQGQLSQVGSNTCAQANIQGVSGQKDPMFSCNSLYSRGSENGTLGQEVDEPKDGVSAKYPVPEGYLQQTNLTAPTPKSTRWKQNSHVAPASSTPTNKSSSHTPETKKKKSTNCFRGLLLSHKTKHPELSALPVNRKSVLLRLKGKLRPGDIPSSVPVRVSTTAGLDSVPRRILRSPPPPTSSEPPAPSQLCTTTKFEEPAPPPCVSTGPCPRALQMRLDNPNAGIVVLQKINRPVMSHGPMLSYRPDMVLSNVTMMNPPSAVMVTEVNPVRMGQQGGYVPQQPCTQPVYQYANRGYQTAPIMERPQVQVMPEATGFPSHSHQTQGYMIPIQRFVVPRAGVDCIHSTSQCPVMITRDCQQCMAQNCPMLNVPFK